GKVTDEALEIIARLWREDSVDFNGAHFRLKGVSISPKPVQPDLPMWIGGASEAAIRRTARYGTGWQAGGETPADAGRAVSATQAGSWRRPRGPSRKQAAPSTTIITARAFLSISAAPAKGRWRRRRRLTPSVPAAIRHTTLPSVTSRRSSSGSPSTLRSAWRS